MPFRQETVGDAPGRRPVSTCEFQTTSCERQQRSTTPLHYHTMSTPRTTALKNQNRHRELELLETIKKAELKAARKQAADAHQSAGG